MGPDRPAHAPSQSEGDVNSTPRRAAWQREHLDAPTRALLARDGAAFLHQSVSTPCLSAIRKAEGIWIEDVAGRRYMDFHGNNVHHVGYAHPHVIASIKAQLDELSFAPRRFAAERAVELAEALGAQFQRLTGSAGRVLFTTGGSDAVEVAIKLARAATGRFKTLSFWDSFHGAGFGAASVGGESLFRSGRIGPLLPGTEHVAPFGCYRCAYGHPVDADGAAAPRAVPPGLRGDGALRAGARRRRRRGDRRTGARRALRAAAGLLAGGAPGLQRSRHAADLRRDSRPASARPVASSPPSTTAPRPTSWCSARRSAAACCRSPPAWRATSSNVAGDWAFGHYTHEKNPVTARAALATLEVIEREGLVENAARVGAHALDRLHEMKRRHALIGDVRGRGLLLGLELVTDREAKTPAGDAAERVLYRALSRGLSFKTTMGNVLTLTPPLVTTIAQMDDALDILDACLVDEAAGAGC